MRDQFAPAGAGEAIDLARVADFTLGGLRVQPSVRRIRAGPTEEPVEPRVMQALIALVEADGAVVSRDVLIDRCWGGRIVGDDAINRCIAKVRRLAELIEPDAFSVETVPKVGYRLKLSEVPCPAARGIDTPPPPAGAQHGRPMAWLALGLAVAGAAAAGLRLAQPTARWVVQSSHQLLPRLDGETSPRFSPDGSMLAYAVGARAGHGQIFVRNPEGGPALPVSAPAENADAPAWASDGTHLAYVVTDPAGGPCRIMVTKFPGGTPTVAGRCRHAASTQIAWQPATPYLFIGDDLTAPLSFALFRLDIETGAEEEVTNPANSETDYAPHVSPDGKFLAYLRGHGLAGQSLRLHNIITAEERDIACDPNVGSIDWTADSQTLIASVSGQMGSTIVALPIDGGASHQVYASAGSLAELATGPHGLLAVDVEDARHDLARASRTPRKAADLIDPAAGITDWPSFAPDGTLAFVSNRSGRMALWVRRPGQEAEEIVDAGAATIERDTFSPDGSRIAFVELRPGAVEVHVVTAQGRSVATFTVPSIGFGMPNWTPDGDHLVMYDKQIMQPVRISVRNPEERVPAEGKLVDGVIYHDGATYAASGLLPGIWRLDGGARLVTGHYPVRRHPRLAFAGNDVLLPDQDDSGTMRILAQPLKGGAARIAYYAPAAERDSPIAVDPLTGDVVYVSEVAAERHLDVLTLVKQ